MPNFFDSIPVDGGTAVAEPPAPKNFFDTIPVEDSPAVKPEGVLKTIGREFSSRIAPAAATGVGGVLGGLAAGAIATPETVGIGTIPAAIAGDVAAGTAAGYAAEKAQNALMGEEWVKQNEAQRRANAEANPMSAQLGGLVPFLLSMVGGGYGREAFKGGAKVLTKAGEAAAKAGTAVPKIESMAQAAAGGARAGGGEGGAQAADTGDFSHIPDDIAKSALAFGATGMFAPAKSILQAATGRAVKDAAAMTLANEIYDVARGKKDFDLKATANELGGSIPAFALQNAILGALHGRVIPGHALPLTAPKEEAAPASGATAPPDTSSDIDKVDLTVPPPEDTTAIASALGQPAPRQPILSNVPDKRMPILSNVPDAVVPEPPAPDKIPSIQEAQGVLHDLQSPEIGQAVDPDMIEMALDNFDAAEAKGRSIDWSRESNLMPNVPTSTVPSLKKLAGSKEGRDVLREAININRQKAEEPPPEVPEHVAPIIEVSHAAERADAPEVAAVLQKIAADDIAETISPQRGEGAVIAPEAAAPSLSASLSAGLSGGKETEPPSNIAPTDGESGSGQPFSPEIPPAPEPQTPQTNATPQGKIEQSDQSERANRDETRQAPEASRGNRAVESGKVPQVVSEPASSSAAPTPPAQEVPSPVAPDAGGAPENIKKDLNVSEGGGKGAGMETPETPKRVRVAGAEYDVVRQNPDGTLKLKSEGGEFDTEPGEKWVALDATKVEQAKPEGAETSGLERRQEALAAGLDRRTADAVGAFHEIGQMLREARDRTPEQVKADWMGYLNEDLKKFGGYAPKTAGESSLFTDGQFVRYQREKDGSFKVVADEPAWAPPGEKPNPKFKKGTVIKTFRDADSLYEYVRKKANLESQKTKTPAAPSPAKVESDEGKLPSVATNPPGSSHPAVVDTGKKPESEGIASGNRDVTVYHASESEPGKGQKSGYYPGTYTSDSPSGLSKHGPNLFTTKVDSAKIWKGQESSLKDEAANAGFGRHSGNGQAEVEYLKSKGYEGLRRGSEIILFDSSEPKWEKVETGQAKPRPMNMAGQVRPEKAKPIPTPEFASIHQKAQEKFNEAFDTTDVAKMVPLLDKMNKGMRAEFQKRTGEKLPATQKGTADLVEAWGAKTPASELSDEKLSSEILRLGESSLKPNASEVIKRRSLELSKEYQARLGTKPPPGEPGGSAPAPKEPAPGKPAPEKPSPTHLAPGDPVSFKQEGRLLSGEFAGKNKDGTYAVKVGDKTEHVTARNLNDNNGGKVVEGTLHAEPSGPTNSMPHSEAQDHLDSIGVPRKKVRVVDKPDEFWQGRWNSDGSIDLNTAHIGSKRELMDILFNHENTHDALMSGPEGPKLAKALEGFTDALSEKELGEIHDALAGYREHGVSAEDMRQEHLVQMVRKLTENRPDLQTKWGRFVDSVTLAIKKFLGIKNLSRARAELLAAQILARGTQRVMRGEMNVGGGKGELFDQAELVKASAQHAELEAKHNAGTITPEETAKAQRLVDEAAKRAGYTEAAGHATPFNFTEFDRSKIGHSDPDTYIRGFHFSNEPSPHASYVSGGPHIDRGPRGKTKIINAYLQLGRVADRYTGETLARKQIDKWFRENPDANTPPPDEVTFPHGYDSVEFVRSLKYTEEKQREFDKKGEISEGSKVFVRSPEGGVDYYTEADDYGPRSHITSYENLKDAYESHGESHYIVRSPTQIKSAEPFTGVPLKERFNPESPSILYSLKPSPSAAAEHEEAVARAEASYRKETTKDKIITAAKEVATGLRQVRSLLAPASVSPEAQLSAGFTRQRAAELEHRRQQGIEALKSAKKMFDEWGEPESIAFIDRLEKDQKQATPELEALAKTLRAALDSRVDAVRKLGTGKLANVIEDYFPHIWEKPDEAKSAYQRIFGKRPLEGSKAFLKQRTIPTTLEGMSWRVYDSKGDLVDTYKDEAAAQAAAAGVTDAHVSAPMRPVTYNPVELTLMKIHEMDRYIMGQRLLADLKGQKLLTAVPYGQRPPQGYTAINDSIARTNIRNPGTGKMEPAVWHAPADASRVLNNYLSPGLRGVKVFDAWRGIGNAMNMAQLGMSAFHAGMVSADSMISSGALGLEQLARGRFSEAAKSFAKIPIAPIYTMMKGHELMKQYKADQASLSPEWRYIIDSFNAGGGRASMDSFYRTGAVGAFTKALKAGNYPGAVFRLPFAALEAVSHPLMEFAVPRMKLGIFYDMAREELARMPATATQPEVQKRMGKIWDSIDNRMGQLVYDNLFWHKALKDTMMASVRSVGWNLGTIRELGGGFKDMLTVKSRLKDGGDFLTHRMAYTIMMPVVAGIIGGIYQYLKTGETPQDLKDWYMPRTGATKPDGSAERVELPTYMKDVVSYRHHPGQTILNKLHPLANSITEMYANKDFYGNEIRDSDAEPVKQLQQEVEFIARQFVPFTVRNAGQRQPGSGIGAESFFGINPAPAELTRSDAQNKMVDFIVNHSPQGGRTPEEAARTQARKDLLGRMRQGEDVRKELKESPLSVRQQKQVIRDSRTDPVLTMFKHLSASEAADVLELADEKEKDVLTKPFIAKYAKLPLKDKKEIQAKAKGGTLEALQRIGAIR